MSCRGEMGEGASRSSRMEPHSGKRRPVWTASSQKIGPKCVRRGWSNYPPSLMAAPPYFIVAKPLSRQMLLTYLCSMTNYLQRCFVSFISLHLSAWNVYCVCATDCADYTNPSHSAMAVEQCCQLVERWERRVSARIVKEDL